MREEKVKAEGIRISLEEEGVEIGHGFLYLMYNDLHKRPFGLIEDVYLEKEFRGKGLGVKIINKIIEIAKEKNCYKLIGTSRYGRDSLHKYYEKLGFKDYGKEFRMNF